VTPVNGKIYAFSRRDGAPLWQSPATVRGFGMPIEQPDDLPTLWLVRSHRLGQSPQTQSNQTEVVCLDRRTGGLLLDRRNVASPVTMLQVTVDVNKREIGLVLQMTSLVLQFTDEPRPPEPPVQLTSTSGGLRAILRKATEGILNSVAGLSAPTPSAAR
jgi:hypothetical protein